MPQFIFNLPSEDDIRNSTNGGVMLRVINNDFEKRYTLITGCPGSGKTTVSIFRFIRLLNSNKDVWLITYQQMLKVSIQNLLTNRNLPNNRVNTIHKWFPKKTRKLLGYDAEETNLSIHLNTGTNEYILSSSTRQWKFKKEAIEVGIESNLVKTDYTTHLKMADGVNIIKDWGENKFYRKLSSSEITALLPNQGNAEMIIDEGQDLEERIYQSFPQVFGRLTIGADDDQQMYNGNSASENEIMGYLEPDVNHFILQFNYRNTYQIYNFARFFIPNSLKANNSETMEALNIYNNDGDLPQVLGFEEKGKLLDRLKRIIEDNRVGFNIGILVSKIVNVDSYHQKIVDMDFECSKYHSKMPNTDILNVEQDLKNILVTTFISAKGMEFDIVIMPEFDDMHSKKQIYVGCTRAKSRLVLMYTGQSLPTMLSGFPKDSYDNGKLFGNESESTTEEYHEPADDLPF